MDEPSSALDALHEKELLHTLNTEYGGKDPASHFSPEQHPHRLRPDPENGGGEKIKLLFFSRVCYTFGRTRKKENNNGK